MSLYSALSSIGSRFSLRDRKVWLAFFGGETWAGKHVSPDTAMQLAAFWACVRLTAETIGTLPLKIYERRSDGSGDAVPTHALYRLLHDQPNADQTAVEFWEAMTACLLLWGNAFAEKTVSVGQVRALVILPPDRMTVYRDRLGALRYRYAGPKGPEEYSEEQIFHIRGFGIGNDVGLSPVSYARQTLSTAMAANEAAGRTFANGMKPSGFFKYQPPEGTEPVLTEEQRVQVRKVLVEAYSGSGNTARAGVLEGHFDWQSVTIQPRDAELLLSRRFEIEEICRWFGMPPILIGHAADGQTMWGSGVEQIMLAWLMLGLRSYLKRIESAINIRLIAPAERSRIYAEFNPDGLLRGDSASQAAFMSSMAQNGFMTRNQGRALKNWPPMPGGDMLTVQSNLVPLDMLGKQPPRQTQPAPGDPIPGLAA